MHGVLERNDAVTQYSIYIHISDRDGFTNKTHYAGCRIQFYSKKQYETLE